MGKSNRAQINKIKNQILNHLKNGSVNRPDDNKVIDVIASRLALRPADVQSAIGELAGERKVVFQGRIPYISYLALSDEAREEKAPFIPSTPEQRRQSLHARDPRGYGYRSTIRPGDPNYRDDLVTRNATLEEWIAMGNPADTYPFAEQASFDVAEVADAAEAHEGIEPATALSELNEQVLVQFIKDALDQAENNLMLLSELKRLIVDQFGVTIEEVGSLLGGLREKQVTYWHRMSFGGAFYISFAAKVSEDVKLQLKGGHPTRAQALTRLEELIEWIRSEAKNYEGEAIPTEVITTYHMETYGLSPTTASKDISLLAKQGLIRYKPRRHSTWLIQIVKPLTFKEKLNLALEGVRETAKTAKPLKHSIGSRIGSDSREAYNFARYLRHCGAYRYLDRQNPVVDLQTTPISDEQVESVKQLIASGLYTPQTELKADSAPIETDVEVESELSAYQAAQAGFTKLGQDTQETISVDTVTVEEVQEAGKQAAQDASEMVVDLNEVVRRLTVRINDLKGQNAQLSEIQDRLQEDLLAKAQQVEDLTIRVEVLEVALNFERTREVTTVTTLGPTVDNDLLSEALKLLED